MGQRFSDRQPAVKHINLFPVHLFYPRSVDRVDHLRVRVPHLIRNK